MTHLLPNSLNGIKTQSYSIAGTRRAAWADKSKSRASGEHASHLIECLKDKIKALRNIGENKRGCKVRSRNAERGTHHKAGKLNTKCEKLEAVMRVLFNTLNIKMPDLSEIEEEQEETVEGSISLWDGKESSKNMGPLDGPYEDEARRAFYEDIPDIKEMVPCMYSFEYKKREYTI